MTLAEAAPIVRLARVAAADAAGPRGRPRGRLAGVDLDLGAGVHAVLGAPGDGTLALADVLSGRAAPRRGRVLVAGLDPARTPAIRARIGALAPAPELPDAGSVEASIELALRARGEVGGGAGALLEPFGLGRLLARRPAALSFAEARGVELALALTTPEPVLAVLFEPLADVAGVEAAVVHERARDLAGAGACVVVVTSSAADARSFGERLHVLDRGSLASLAPGAADGGAEPELLVLVQEPAGAPAGPAAGVRALAAALAGSPAVTALAWEGPRAGGDVSALRVRAADRDAAALAVLDAAVAAEVVVAGISSPAPSLRALRAAAATPAFPLDGAAHPGAGPAAPRPFGAPSSEGAPVAVAASAPAPAPASAPDPDPGPAARGGLS